MRAPKNESVATAGQNEVIANFERIGWGPIPNPFHDLGTDLFVVVRDERRFDRGLFVGVQVKSGSSWFKDPEKDANGVIQGWWFYESGIDHFDDWVTHGLPYLVVLHDMETKTSYWAHVTAERCVVTGKGCKLLVPSHQTVDSEHAEALLAIAALQKARAGYEGRAFDAAATQVPPGRRLRYALLTPRLVAPHANAGIDRPLEPEEALALLAKCSFQEFGRYAKKFPAQFDEQHMGTQVDWRWRLVHALWSFLTTDRLDALEALVDSASAPRERAAVTAILASAYYENEQFERALTLLDKQIGRDDLDPVDFAWLLAHSARMRLEIGDISQARAHAVHATKAAMVDRDDPTAGLLSGVAVSFLFFTANLWTKSHKAREEHGDVSESEGSLADTINARDSVASWWRSQTFSWALTSMADKAFKAWAGDTSVKLIGSDEAAEQFLALRFGAGCSADQDAWRMAVRNQACYELGQSAGDTSQIVRSLDALRRSGDEKALKLAAERIWLEGPVLALREAGESVSFARIGRSTASTTFTLWKACADALGVESASAAATACIDLLLDSDTLSRFSERFQTTFIVPFAAAESLVELLPVADASTHKRAAQLLLAMHDQESILSQPMARLAQCVLPDALVSVGLERLRAKATTNADPLFAARLLAALGDAGDAVSSTLLLERALASDWAARSFVVQDKSLNETNVIALISALVTKVDAIVADAKNQRYGMGGPDFPFQLTLLNLGHPACASWDPLIAFLAEPSIPTDIQSNVVQLLADRADELDDGLRKRLLALVPSLVSPRRALPFGPSPSIGPVRYLEFVLDEDVERQQRSVARLLSDAPSLRRSAARILGGGSVSMLRPALLALLGDADVYVRASAADAIGRRVCAGDGTSSMLAGIDRVVKDAGGAAPLGLLNGMLSQTYEGSAIVLDSMKQLREHSSHKVRQGTQQFFNGVSAKNG